MAKRDLFNNIEVGSNVIPYAAHAASIAIAAATTVDTYGYYGIVFVVGVGAVTDSTHLLTLYESDTDVTGNYTAVVAGDLLGNFPTNITTLTNMKVGYVGTKRYLRLALTWTTSGAGTGGVYGATAILGYPLHKPAVNP